MKKARPHAAALRKGRTYETGRIYLITCVTWQRRDVFSECGLRPVAGKRADERT